MEKIYGIDQQILDERGIGLTVSQVVNLSSSEYSARLRRLCLPPRDEAYVKRLRRRIKNRMASQNSRRRTADHIKTLKVELRAVRAGKQHALEQRRGLLRQREALAERCRTLAKYLLQKLSERSDSTPLPTEPELRVGECLGRRQVPVATRQEGLALRRVEEIYRYDSDKISPNDAVLDFTILDTKHFDKSQRDADLKPNIKFEADRAREISIKDNVDKEDVPKIFSNFKIKTEYNKMLDQDMSPGERPKIIRAKCVSIKMANDEIYSPPKNFTKNNFMFKDEYTDPSNDDLKKPKKVMKKKTCIVHNSDVQYDDYSDSLSAKNSHSSNGEAEVLNLSVRCSGAPRRRQHGRKQPAPRRVTRVGDDDEVLDLKMRIGD